MGIFDRFIDKRVQEKLSVEVEKAIEIKINEATELLEKAKGSNIPLPPFAQQRMRGFPIYGNSSAQQQVNKFVTTDDVYSIVRRIAKTAAMIPLTVYKVKDKQALKAYEFATKRNDFSTRAMVQKELLKKAALEKAPDDNDLQFLLDNPNPLYPKNEFREGLSIFRLLTGNTYIYTPLLEFGPNAGKVAEIWILPSQFMNLQVADTWPRQILSYVLRMKGLINFDPSEVIHIRYFNPDFTYVGNELIGLSPLRAGNKVLEKQQAETDYSVNAFQNCGISGIVTNENLTEDDASTTSLGKMKSDFYGGGTGVENARKLLFALGKWGYTEIGLSPVDMDMIASAGMTFKKTCNLYGISDMLFNNNDASTFSNLDEMVRQLYTNAALPEVYAQRDAFNSFLTPKFNSKGNTYYIDCDLSGITELQEDMAQMATVFMNLPIMIPNLIMEAFNYPKSNDPMMDEVYVKQGYSPIKDIQSIPDLPIVTEDGN